MFSFFRRQVKKQGGGNNKKSNKKSPSAALINEIQCLPVNKFEINFIPLPTPKQGDPISSSTQIMGNFASAPSPADDSESSEDLKLNNNMYLDSQTKLVEFQWTTKPTPQDPQTELRCLEREPRGNEVPIHAQFSTTMTKTLQKEAGDEHTSFGTAPNSSTRDLRTAREAFFETDNSMKTGSETANETTARDETKSHSTFQPSLNVNNFQIMLSEKCDQIASKFDDIRFVDSEDEEFLPTEAERPHQPSPPLTMKPESNLCIGENGKHQSTCTTKIHLETEAPCSSYTQTNGTTEDDDDEYEEAEEPKMHARPDVDVRLAQLKVPDITITESSDSEGENDSEEEYDMRYFDNDPHYGERTYPSILYDITEVDEPYSDASDLDASCYHNDKSNNIYQDSKYQEPIKSLKGEVKNKDTANMQLLGKINELQRDILNKTLGTDRLKAELSSYQKEADCVRNKLSKVEEDLLKYKTENTEINKELLKSMKNESNLETGKESEKEAENLKCTIRDLRNELDLVIYGKQELQKQLTETQNESTEKIKTLEMALDETLKEKQKLQARFDAEYEKLRTVNSDREQQLVDDFEWKLREVELKCKHKLEDKDNSHAEKIRQIQKQLENEIQLLKDQLIAVEKLKSYEAEASQLRGLIQEQERSLRMALKSAEQLQNNQKILDEETDKLRSALDKERAHLATVQGIHSREIAEKDRKYLFKLEQQKNEINTQWEEKIRRESTRLKLEMERQLKEEKRNLLEEAKQKSEQQLKNNNEMWEKKMLDNKKQLEILEKQLTNRNESYHEELLKFQSESDSSILELRRKLDKMDLSYQGQLEKQQEQHEKETENLRDEYEKKIQQNEQTWSQQVASTRATLELIKEQLQRDTAAQMEALNKKYMMQLEQQYDRLITEKQEAVSNMRENCANEMNILENELNEQLKTYKDKENEILKVIEKLKLELAERDADVVMLKQTHADLQNTVTKLNEKVSMYENSRRGAETALKKQQIEQMEKLTKMKELYENENKKIECRILTNVTDNVTHFQRSDSVNKAEDNRNTTNQSKSSRKKGRGRHKNQKNYHPQITQQHSFSSL